MVDRLLWAAEIRQYATEHYEQDGWDYVVECYSDSELVGLFGDATTKDQAQAALLEHCQLWAERRRDIQSEVF